MQASCKLLKLTVGFLTLQDFLTVWGFNINCLSSITVRNTVGDIAVLSCITV